MKHINQELLEALRDILEAHTKLIEHEWRYADKESWLKAYPEVIKARSAIAKATGQDK